MELKVLDVEGSAEEVYDGVFGTHAIYSEGSKRLIFAYFLFPKTLEGEKRRGFQTVEQEASICLTTDGHDSLHYNKWKNVKFRDVKVSVLETKL